MTCGFLIQLVFCKEKKTMWFIGVEVGQETSAPPPKKDPGSAPAANHKCFTCLATPRSIEITWQGSSENLKKKWKNFMHSWKRQLIISKGRTFLGTTVSWGWILWEEEVPWVLAQGTISWKVTAAFWAQTILFYSNYSNKKYLKTKSTDPT